MKATALFKLILATFILGGISTSQMSAQTTTVDVQKFLEYYGTTGLLDDGTTPPDITPRWYTSEYHHVTNPFIVQTAQYTQGIDGLDGVDYVWYFNNDFTEPWWVGETWMIGEPLWECDNRFYITLEVQYGGQTWSRTTAAHIWWQGDLYDLCPNAPTLDEVIFDGFAMSFGEFEPYFFLDWPAHLDTNNDWKLNSVDLLDLLSTFEQ